MLTGGAHVPLIPLLEVVGKIGAVAFWQTLGIAVNVGVIGALIVNATVEEPLIEGLLEITLIKYPVPVEVPPGIEAAIVPELAVLLSVPITVGLAKLPAASLN